MDLTPYLQDVEARIDPMEEDALAAAWLEFCDLKCTKPYFYINRKPKPSALTWPRYTINDGFRHQDIMLYLQLKSVSDTLAGGGGAMLAVRANYGTGIIPSMFGTEIFALADHQNTLPGTVPLERGMEAVREIAAEGKIDYTKGLAPQVFSFGEKWLTLAAQYPKIAKYVHLYCPDLQGPYPLLDMLVGYDLFFSLYDEPDDVKAAMDFITEVYLDFTRKWFSLAPTYDDDHAVEWGLLHRGKIMLRND
ncbi:MAG: hypothetical protein IJX14_09020, partial [Clostridia bacterium]|nr:hypothetical protein [Clostridia bacterium]